MKKVFITMIAFLAISSSVMADGHVDSVRYLTTKNQADHLVQAMSRFQHRVSENATAGYNRWRDASYEGSARRTSNNP